MFDEGEKPVNPGGIHLYPFEMGCDCLLEFQLAAPAKVHYYVSMLPYEQVYIIGLELLIN